MPIWLGAVEENTSADRCTECYAARQPKWWPVGALQDSKSRILLAKALSDTKVCGLKKKKKFVDFSGLLRNFLVVMLTWQKLSSPNYMQP